MSDCITLCGPEAVGAKDGSTMVHSENTSYSIPLNAPLINVLNGKHHFKFTLPTTSPARSNLPASFVLNFPKSNDSCSISYVLEYVRAFSPLIPVLFDDHQGQKRHKFDFSNSIGAFLPSHLLLFTSY